MSAEEELARYIVSMEVQDNDVLGRITAILDQVRTRFTAAFSNLPGVGTDLIEAGIGKQVATVDEAIVQMERLKGIMAEVQGSLGVGVSNNVGAAFIDAEIGALDRLIAKTREAAAIRAELASATSVPQAEAAAVQAVRERGPIVDEATARTAGTPGSNYQVLAQRLSDAGGTIEQITTKLQDMGVRGQALRDILDGVTTAETRAAEAYQARHSVATAEAAAGSAVASRGTLGPNGAALVAESEARLDAGAQARLVDDVTTAKGRLVTAVDKVAANVQAVLGEEDASKIPAALARLDTSINARDSASRALAAAEQRLADATEKQAAAAATAAERQANIEAIPQNPVLAAAASGDSSALLDAMGVEQARTLKIQQLQLDTAILERKQLELASASETAAAEGDIASLTKLADDQARLRLQIAAKRNAIEEQTAAEDAASGGNGGFFGGLLGTRGGGGGGGGGDILNQAGFALKYYAFYQVFAIGQKLITDTRTATEQYSLAVNQLTIALGGNYEAASQMAQQYASIATNLAVAPATAVNAATQFTRAYRDTSGSAGLIGAQVGSVMQLLESTGDPEKDQQANQKRLEDLIAISKNYGTGAAGASQVYDEATKIGQLYGYQKGGDLLSGTAQIADLLKGSGFSQEQGLALVASVMQSTGGNSDQAAGDLKRFLGRQGQTSFNDIFSKYGINQNQTLEQELQQFAPIFQGLDSSQQEAIIGKLGGGRAGAAVQAVLENYKELNASAKEGANSVGAAQDQASERLKKFAGEIEKLHGDITAIATDVGNSGIGDVFGLALQSLDPLLRGVDDLLKYFNSWPTAIKDVTAALILMKAAGAISGGGGITGFLGNVGGLVLPGMGRGAAGAAESAAVSGGEAVVERSGLAAAMAGVSGLAASAGGLATAAGSAALALGPLAIILGTLAVMGQSADQQARDAANAANASAALKASKAVGDRGSQADPGAVKGALAQLESAKSAVDREIHNSSGIDDFWTATGHWDAWNHMPADARQAQARSLQAQIDARKEQQQQAEAVQAASEAAASRGAGEAAIFDALPDGGFGNIPGGLNALKSQRVPVAQAAKDLNALINKTFGDSVDALEKLFNPAQGDQGFQQELQRQAKLVGTERDPAQQLADYGTILKEAQTALASATQSGDATLIDQAQTEVDTASKAYYALLVKNTKAKVDSIKALEGNNAKSQAEIRAIVTQALNEAAKGGDVDTVVQLLAGVDKAFLTSYTNQVKGMIAALQAGQAALNKAAALATQEAQFAAADTSGADSANAVEHALQQTKPADGHGFFVGNSALNAAAANAQKIADQQKILDTINLATPYSAPSGSDFKFPKEPKTPGPTAAQIEEARLAAQEIPGDPLSAAATNLAVARYKMSEPKNAEQYWQAVKALHQAQYDYAKAQLAAADDANLLAIDMTDPVAMAREKVTAAAAQLAMDRNRGALYDVTNKDQVALRQAQNDAEKQAFSQQFSDAQTNYQLQRISLGAYLSYLNSQHDYLTSVQHKSRQQIDELNQVDQALQSLAQQMQGQFNLGAITMPSVYEVRRAVVSGAYSNAITNNVTIQIAGTDQTAVRSVLGEYLGQGVMQTVSVTPSKV